MGPNDFDFALRITAREGWGYVRGDFERLLSLTPGGSFIASVGGRRVGLLTTLCQRNTCWIGNVVVATAFRQMGIGRQLVSRALDHAAASGIDDVGLMSRTGTVGFYGEMGFVKGPRLIGLGGVPEVPGSSVPDRNILPISEKHLPEVIRLDSEGAGDHRGPMLASFSRDFKRHFLVHIENGHVDGFIVGKPGTRGMDVGPWTCRRGSRRTALALFLDLASRRRGAVEICVPERMQWAIRFLRRAGLRKAHHFVEMMHGAPRPVSRRVDVLAPAGLEKG